MRMGSLGVRGVQGSKGQGVCQGIQGAVRGVTRAGAGACPYRLCRGQYNDAVDMVGHHDEGICLYARISIGQFIPGGEDHPAGWVQLHLVSDHTAEQAGSTLCANGDRIPTRLRVVIAMQANRPPMMSRWIVRHGIHTMSAHCPVKGLSCLA